MSEQSRFRGPATEREAGLGRTVKIDKVGPDGEPLDFVGRAALEYRASRDARAELDGDAPARVLVVSRAWGVVPPGPDTPSSGA